MKKRTKHAGMKPAVNAGIAPALLATTVSGILSAAAAYAQEPQASPDADAASLEDVVILTGYRRSLEDAALAKRDSVIFTESVFAEDIGKFPDLNIAESLNRMPGVQLSRDINGEGVNIAIRGLGTTFTKIVMNGAQVAVASTGPTDAQNQNRELDLDLFPMELFTQLDVNKTQRASMIEGGASGLVNMRTARAFDNPGTNFDYQLQNGYGELTGKLSPRGAFTASWTNDTFGVLAGAAAVRTKTETHGFESIGWTNPTVTHGQCGTTPDTSRNETLASVSPQCNSTGGNGYLLRLFSEYRNYAR